MMKLIKNILNDVYFVSKITSVGNKKLILLTVIVLSQVTAFTDVALIVIFAAIITGTYDQGIVAPVVEFFLEYTFFLPILIIARFLFTYIHEVAHAAVYQRWGRKPEPHGKEWKQTFSALMQPLFHQQKGLRAVGSGKA